MNWCGIDTAIMFGVAGGTGVCACCSYDPVQALILWTGAAGMTVIAIYTRFLMHIDEDE